MTMLVEKFSKTRKEMADGLVEREAEIDLVLTAVVAQEHCLLVGPPGVAKSLLIETVGKWMNTPVFQYLLTKFTEPGEILGPVNIAALKEGRYERLTEGFAPQAVLFFGDEIFKAGSALLNCLLSLLNERVIRIANKTLYCPLRLFLGASNEYPSAFEGGKELAALFDRLLLRKTVRPVATPEGRDRLWFAPETLAPKLSTRLTIEELDEAHSLAMKLDFSDEARDAVKLIGRELGQQGIVPGDRRCVKAAKVCKAAAWLDGAKEVGPSHLEILAHVLWDDPVQEQATGETVARVANPLGAQVTGRMVEANQVIDGLAKVSRTDPSFTPQAIAAVNKLREIARQLKALKGQSPKALSAWEYVDGKAKELLASCTE